MQQLPLPLDDVPHNRCVAFTWFGHFFVILFFVGAWMGDSTAQIVSLLLACVAYGVWLGADLQRKENHY